MEAVPPVRLFMLGPLLCLLFFLALFVLSVVLLVRWIARAQRLKAIVSTPSSCPPLARLREFLDGRLSQNELSEHIETCERCQERLELLSAGKESWSGVAQKLSEPPPTQDPALRHVMDNLKAEASVHAIRDVVPAADDQALNFLNPSDKPGDLGRLGPYEVQEVIGRGGMGVVLKAFDPSLHRVVAIKVLAPQLATSATARRRFTREAQAAAAVSHDHVVTIHAVDEANGVPYLVMQYVAGMSLQERLDKGGPLELKEILRIGMQTAAGLAAAHAQGLIHRDIKPANILLENGVQRVKITDFGLARAADDASLTQSGVVAGTPQYMAPEQACGEAVDHRADLFSLGSVLYALCTGRPPFCASTPMAVLRRVSDDTPRPIKELNPEIPDWLVAIVDKLHAKNPADRFQTASAVAELLNQHLARLQQASWTPMPGGLAEKAPVAAASADAPITSLTICPSCGSHLYVPDKMVGRVVSCPQCGKPFQAEDTSQEIQVIQAGKPQLAQLAKPKRKIPLSGWLLGGVAVLFLLCCGGLGLFTVDYVHTAKSARPPFTTRATIRTAIPPPPAPHPSQEALSWFPADATFFGTIDLRQLWAPNPVDQDLQQKLLDQLVAPHIRRQLITGQSGNPRIDRIAFAYSEDTQRPERSRLYVRLTGQFDRQRMLSVLSREVGEAKIYKSRPGTPIALIHGLKLPLACGLVGNTDVILAGYAGPGGGEDHPLNIALRLRDGFGQSLMQARSADLQLAPPHACGLLIGQLPGTLGKEPAVQSLFSVLPYQVTVSLASDLNKPWQQDQDLLLSFVLRMKNPGQDREFVASVAQLKREGVERLLKAYPQIRHLDQPLRSALEGIKIDADQGVVSGDVRIARSSVPMLCEILRQVLTRD